jgi:hypothetical protein
MRTLMAISIVQIGSFSGRLSKPHLPARKAQLNGLAALRWGCEESKHRERNVERPIPPRKDPCIGSAPKSDTVL